MHRPPRLAATLLEWVLPPAHRNGILGDLAELHGNRAATAGRIAACWWYWRTALSMTLAFALEPRRRPLERRLPEPGDLMRGSIADVRFAWRMVRKNPWMSAAAAMSLAGAMAVAIGGFSLLWDTYFAELPFAHADRIVAVRMVDTHRGGTAVTRLGVVREWRDRQRRFDAIGAASTRSREIADGAGGAARYPVSAITASGFRVTGVEAALGRTLLPSDEAPGAEPVVVLGHRVWTTLFGSDQGVVGRLVDVGGESRRVVGVMPDGFRFPMSEDLWIPFRIDAASVGGVEPRWVRVFGRLAAGTTVEQAESELESIRAGQAALHPDDPELNDQRTAVLPYVQSDSGPEEAAMFQAMFAFIVLILGVACASVANLLLCRTMARRGEIAVRAAMGASRARLVSQLLIEALLITSAAAVAGVGAAWVGLRWFNGSIPIERLPFWVHFGISSATAAFATVTAFVAAVLAGVAPALRATGGDLVEVLKDQQRSLSGVRFGAISGALTVAEITIAVAGLAAAGLAGRSLLDATGTAAALPGQETLVAEVRMADEFDTAADGSIVVPAGAIEPERWGPLAEDLRAAIAGLPGVRGAAIATTLPMQQHPGGEIEMDGPAGGDSPAGVRVVSSHVTPEIFDVFGGRLLAGRLIERADAPGADAVAVVNRTMAQRFFGSAWPVGRRFRPAEDGGSGGWITIVGVVDDLPMNPASDGQPGYYRPFAQTMAGEFGIAVRVDGPPLALAPSMKLAAARLDHRVDIADFETHSQLATSMLVSYKMMALVFIGLGGAALFLAVAGLYAVMSFSVTQRTREIGIRVALGASALRATTIVLRRGFRQIAIGLTLGSAAGWILMRLIGAIPIGMSPAGPSLLALAAGVMFAAGGVACLVPAARALRVQPVEALRHD